MDSLMFNGIDIRTGAYAQPELTLAELARIVSSIRTDLEHERDLKRKVEEATPSFAPLPGVQIDDLAQTGWGVIFPHGADPGIKEALAPLLRLREKQTIVKQRLFRVFEGVNGYRKGESKNDYLKRLPHSVGGGRGVAPGPCNPQRIPYYLLLVGDPQEIPYRFQYELDVDYAVGRLSFATTQEYADYAAAVASADAGSAPPRRAVFFGSRNRGDRPTTLSADHLVGPLARLVADAASGWTIEPVVGDKATKAGLLDLLGGSRTPSVLFTATHGAVLPSGDPQQERRQGALICQDWPGPVAWRKPLGEDFYVSHDDIPDAAKVKGLVAFFFACFSAGTPQADNFSVGGVRQQLAPHDLVAALPRRLLGLPGGGALAVVGHIDRAFSYSFEWGRGGEQLDVYQSMLTQLLAGSPVGAAMEVMNQFYASIATMLGNELEDIQYGKDPADAELAGLWTANNDARNFVLLGDPAVRLKVRDAT
ncbi:MAG TPA: hypothetical protein VGY66_33665 [Gemmataceae bacterium]|jgi:hypothetical protein|nr:hypothetical protein [Gemmataceae bacterium]